MRAIGDHAQMMFAIMGRGGVVIQKHEVISIDSTPIQRSDKVGAQGCVNTAGKLRQKR